MTKESREHLSSLMDGELSRETGLFMARRLCSDAELSGAWRRYHLIRDCIREPGGRVAVVDLTARVGPRIEDGAAEALAHEPRRRWLRPAAGLAVAASVALVAVALVGQDLSHGPAGPGDGVAQESGSFNSPNTLPAVPVSQPASYSPGDRDTERRLNSYLLRHNQMAGAGRQGFVSFVSIISTPQQEAEEAGSAELAEQQGQTTTISADPGRP